MSKSTCSPLNISLVFTKSSGCKFFTRLARLVWRNLNESINLNSILSDTVFPSLFWYSSTFTFFEKEIYFSSVEGIHVKSPFILDNCLINKWASYPWRLWNITGIIIGFRHFRLQLRWAGPRYSPVKWQWSQTLSSGSNSFLHIWQTVDFLYSLYCFWLISILWGLM